MDQPLPGDARSDLPDLLQLAEIGVGRYLVTQPSDSAEGRDVVFSGQLLAQMILASDDAAGGAKDVRSVHAVFMRAGTYTRPIELEVESLHAGRTWASDTVTAVQAGRLLTRATVLLNVVDADLMRHEPPMPSVPGPAELEPAPGLVFPGAELRPVPGPHDSDGVPVHMAWHRFERPLASQAANQAVLIWATCGTIIGLGMRPHRDRVRIEDAHASISTGVIGHTMHFVDRLDVSQWLLLRHEATKAATGRVYGDGRVFTEDGTLVAAFHQDSMARAAAGPLDPRRSM
jgi:acyl-CoA thioesterase II